VYKSIKGTGHRVSFRNDSKLVLPTPLTDNSSLSDASLTSCRVSIPASIKFCAVLSPIPLSDEKSTVSSLDGDCSSNDTGLHDGQSPLLRYGFSTDHGESSISLRRMCVSLSHSVQYILYDTTVRHTISSLIIKEFRYSLTRGAVYTPSLLQLSQCNSMRSI